MHAARQRLFRLYVQLGGDLADDAEVGAFVHCVEAHLVLLPPKVKPVLERAWFKPTTSYRLLVKWLAHEEGGRLTEAAVRQRLSRGVGLLEAALAAKPWKAANRPVPRRLLSARRPAGASRRSVSPQTGS